MKAEEKQQHWYKSPLLLIWLFLVLTAMSGTIYMVIQANSGFPGLVVDDYYERGQDYEENILKKLQENEKWTTEFHMQDAHLNKAAPISFTIRAKSGAMAQAEKVTLYAYRPSDSKKDFNIPMTLANDKITYQADVSFAMKGKWELIASVVINGTEVNFPKAIFVKD